MIFFITDFLSAIVFMAIALFSFAGYGRFLQNCLGLEQSSTIDAYDLWFGLTFIISLVGFLHLFFPVNWLMTTAVMTPGILYSCWNKEKWLKLFALLRENNTHFKIIGCIGLLSILIGALLPPINFDAGLYYFGSIRWLNESSIIPGLGNLYVQLAYNQSYFNLSALLNFFPYWNHGFALVSPLFLIIAFLTLAQANFNSIFAPHFFKFLLFLLLTSLLPDLSSPRPEVVVGSIEISLFILAIEAISSQAFFVEKSIKKCVCLILISALLFTVKISGLMFALTIPLLVISQIVGMYRDKTPVFYRLVILIITIFIIHYIRAYITSGAPLFPSSIGRIDALSWAVPLSLMHEIMGSLISYAREFAGPDSVIENWKIFIPWLRGNWVVPWFKLSLPSYVRYLFFACILMILIEQFIFWVKLKSPQYKKFYWLYLPLFASSLFWFFTAPLLRHQGVILGLIFIVSLWFLILRVVEIGVSWQWIKRWSFVAPVILIAALLRPLLMESFPWKGWGAIPVISTQEKMTTSGVIIKMPDTGFQCWNSQLPCAPYFYPALSMKEFSLFWGIQKNGFYFPP